MITRCFALTSLLCAFGHAAAEGELPQTMRGQWKSSFSGVVGDTAIELVKLQSPDKAEVKVTVEEVLTRPATEGGGRCSLTEGAVAERQGDSWQIQVRNIRCASFIINIRRVDGMQRLEGHFTNDLGASGPISHEWK